MGYGLGVDLGTTFTGAAVAGERETTMIALNRDGVVESSAVFVTSDGGLLTGDAAVAAGATAPQRLARGFKRRLGDPTPLIVGGAAFSPASLLAAQLRSVLARAHATRGGPPETVVLTCPAVWGPYRREHFDEVPRLAGLTGTVMITEPEAAAAHYAVERRLGIGELVAVYDLGGGTFDTTILRAQPDGMEIIGTPEGIERLGGMDFDEALFAHVDEALGGALSALDPSKPDEAAILAATRQDCVRAKEELSIEPDVTLRVALPSGAREVLITRLAFNDMIRPSVELSIEALERTIASAGLVPDDLSGVLLAGGSSRIPLVYQVVSKALGRPVRAGMHPKFTVALGAAHIARGNLHRSEVPSPGVAPTGPRPLLPRIPVMSRKLMSHKAFVPAAIVAAVVVAAGTVAIVVNAGGSAGVATPTPPPPADAAGRPVAGLPAPTAAATITGVGSRPQGVAITPDGTKVYVPSRDSNTITVIDRATRKVLRTIPTPAPPQYAAMAPGGNLLYVTMLGPANAVAVIDTGRDEIIATVPAGRRMFVPAISRDGAHVYLPDHESSSLWSLDTATRQAESLAPVAAGPRGVALSPDGTRAYVASLDTGQVSVLDLGARKVLATIPVTAGADAIALSPDGKFAYVPGFDANAVAVLDTRTHKVVATVPVGGHPLALAVSADGGQIYVANNADATVSVIDARSRKVTATVPVGAEPWSIALSRDGREAFVVNAVSGSVTVLRLMP